MARVKAVETETPGGASVIDEAPPAESLQTSAKQPEIKMIEVRELHGSPLNPRKHFDPVKLKEVAESIKQMGVLAPLLVRPHYPKTGSGETALVKIGLLTKREPEGYEIVAGERRWRASKLAKLEAVPCLVRDYTDAEALEVMVVENQQRADVTPIEEAEGYKALMKLAGYDVPTIAQKVGMSVSHVYQRMKLAELIEPAKTLLADGHITPGHAVLIARLQPADQEKVLWKCCIRWSTGKPKMDEVLKAAVAEFGNFHLMSVRETANFIEEEVHCLMKGAKFDTDDVNLVPAAGACALCPKRTGFNPDLFADVKEDRCTDTKCFKAKVEAHLKAKVEDVKENLEEGATVLRITKEYSTSGKGKGVLNCDKYKEAKKSDKGAVAAVDVDTGKVKYVKPTPVRSPNGEKQMTAEERAEYERKLSEKIKAEDLFRKLLFKALAPKLPKRFDKAFLLEMAKEHERRGNELIAEVLGLKNSKSYQALSEAELERFILLSPLASAARCDSEWDLKRDHWQYKKLFDLAKEHKIDLKAIDAEVDNQLTGTLPAPKKDGAAPSAKAVSKVMKAEKRKLEKKTKTKSKAKGKR